MAMTTGGNTGLSNDINVTPMIDVLLVLLIIFIMAVPMMRKAIDLQLPDPTPQPNTVQTPPDQIVLQVLPNGAYKINSEAVTKDNLSARLKEIYEPRPDKIIFVKGDPNGEVPGRDLRHGQCARSGGEGHWNSAEGRGEVAPRPGAPQPERLCSRSTATDASLGASVALFLGVARGQYRDDTVRGSERAASRTPPISAARWRSGSP